VPEALRLTIYIKSIKHGINAYAFIAMSCPCIKKRRKACPLLSI